MTGSDEAATSDLLAEYNVVTDALDIDGRASCFAPDGVFNGAYETFRVWPDKERLRHFLSNIRIRVDGDGRRGSAPDRRPGRAAA